MSLRKKFFAMTYDRFINGSEKAGLRGLRRDLLAGAEGRVLEIGAGTGRNLELYPTGVSLTVTEPEIPMLARLERKAHEQAPATTVIQAPAEDLPFEDGTFDVAVSTLVLCGVRDQSKALAEIRRVLKPGGRFLFLEHVRSDDPKLAHRQDRMNPVNRFVVLCDCNRSTLAAIEAAGFTVANLEHGELPKSPSFVRPLITGTAFAPGSSSSPGAPGAERTTARPAIVP
ncbi:MAG: class I SAM-dependent methyltransferase [Acidimicrobiia bacterium]